MIRAVIFDFDGVIANSEPLHFAAFRDVLAAEGVALSEHDYYERYLGYDDVGVFRAVSQERAIQWDDDRVAALVDRKAVHLEALERDGSILFPGADQAIRRLAASLPLAIASGALRLEIQRILNRAGLEQCFGAIVAAEDSPAGKPAPDPVLVCCRSSVGRDRPATRRRPTVSRSKTPIGGSSRLGPPAFARSPSPTPIRRAHSARPIC